jgi:phage protein D
MTAISAYASRAAILVDGQPDATLAANITGVLVEETVEGLYRCEVTFNNFGEPAGPRGLPGAADYLYFGRDVLEFGKEFAVKLGPDQPQAQVFKGRISALEANFPEGGGAQIVALAEDRLQELRMTRRTRSFEDASDADIIEEIAAAHSLTPDVSLEGPIYPSVAQVNQSDLAFIRERARSVNGEVWVEDRTLFAKTRSARGGSNNVNLAFGVELFSFSVRADLAHQCTELGVAGWDVAAKEAILETAEESAVSAELNRDIGGATVLEQAFGPSKQRLVHTVPLTSDEAGQIAKARYRERARRFLTGTGLADGNPNIRVGVFVTLSGLGKLFDGPYYVVRAAHTYDLANGYRTEFDVERPGIGPG